MGSILALGDNTVDVYVDAGMEYPGGNALNVSVLARRLGQTSSYLGCVGTDEAGDWLAEILAGEGVDTSRLRRREGLTARAAVAHRGGDRHFLWSRAGVRAQYELTSPDFLYMAQHALTHTTIYSGTIDLLPRIRQHAEHLSLDLSDQWSLDMIDRVAGAADIVTLSAPEVGDEEAVDLLRRCHRGGSSLAIVTRGARGALISTVDGALVRQEAHPVQVRDTLGAGDGLIARMLVGWLRREALCESAAEAALVAASVCRHEGAFGRGRPARPGLDALEGGHFQPAEAV